MNRSLERQRNILDFTLASLLRRKGKNLSLLAIYIFIVFIIASVTFFTTALKREALLLLSEAPEMVVQRLSAGRHDLISHDYAEGIAAIRGVTAVTPRLWGYYFDPTTGANYTLLVPPAGTAVPGVVTVGAGVARNLGLAADDLLPLRSYRGESLLYTVEAVLSSESELIATDLVLMAAGDFQQLFNMPPGFAVDLAVSVANPRELATVAGKIVERYPDTRPILKSEILRTYDAIFDWRGGMMIVLLMAAVFSFLVFAWDKAAGLSAEERREIGILKSIGWETGDVLLLKFWEGCAVSLSAFCLGVLFAFVHVFVFSAPIFAPALKGWAVIYPAFRLTPEVSPLQLAILFFLTVVPYTVATIVPSWRAATIDPDAAMRQ
ncbi:MAG: FtsX-like permease family protein [Desulfuromonadales bacterium]|nr:FtsX-like permease family protein [Desulfuromonadales bacterium]